MMLTEAEAKTKWCPEVRTGLVAGMAVNHYAGGDDIHDETRCIGSACMAWRWQDSLSPEQQRGAYGYCGKAGKP